MRRLDTGDVRLLRDTGNLIDNVGPAVAAVAADLQVAVVGADPEHARHHRRLPDRDDVAERGGAVVLRGHRRLAIHTHDRPIVSADVPGEVWGGHPRVATIGRAKQPIAAQIDGRRVVPGQHERRVPVEAKAGALGRYRHHVARGRHGAEPELPGAFLISPLAAARRCAATLRSRSDADRPAGLQIETVRRAVLRLRIHDRPVARVVGGVEPVAAADAIPVGIEDAIRGSCARSDRTSCRCPAVRRST